MPATFFPREVLSNLCSLEDSIARDYDDEIIVDARRLAEELRRWERDWRNDKTRLVPQVQPKPNGEGGL